MDDVYKFTFKRTNGNPDTMVDSLEAVRGQATDFDVYVTNSSGAPVGGKTIILTAEHGTVTPQTLITDGSGRGRIADTTSDNICTFTSDGTAGWSEVRAEMEGERGVKNILCHRVRVTDFAQPKLLRYLPDSDNNELSHPTIDFTIEDQPNVGLKFNVTCTIYSLGNHFVVGQRVWRDLAAGHYTKNWNDFFFQSGPFPTDGRVHDPGEGIYPFDVQVNCTSMNAGALNSHHIGWSSSDRHRLEGVSALRHQTPPAKRVVAFLQRRERANDFGLHCGHQERDRHHSTPRKCAWMSMIPT